MKTNTTEHQFTNQLINEKSPYLLQHAHNPVNWYAWNKEAFKKAKEENKPIFLSIGYSTCHWCHVMAHESFEDQEVANILNEHYISIKVDREERPDVDHIYMMACQAMTGQGGWPLTIIMTPDKQPFYAGTYFPKEGKWGRPGLIDILNGLAKKWKEDRDEILNIGEDVIDHITPSFNQFQKGAPNVEVLHEAYHQFANQFDSEFGGFGKAPKFPTPHNLIFLLRYWKKTKEHEALQMVEKTLESMYRGGIYDHIGFGFARYSTDKQWLVPHFEKMLYDNALLAYTYLEAYQATKKQEYSEIAEQIFTYVIAKMTDENGGFYSAEDADSEGVEGKFYVWSPNEIKEILGEEDGHLFCTVFDITDEGNFEGKSIPNLIYQSIDHIAKEMGISVTSLKSKLDSLREKVYLAREKRIHPHNDDKILTSWNGLMIAAFAKGAKVLNNPKYSQIAKKSYDFIFHNLRREADGRLFARYREGEVAHLGYIDDYAFLIWGLIELYEATYDPTYLKDALDFHYQMKKLFFDHENGGYYFYGDDAEQLFARPKEIYDGAIPSGNSVAALNLLKLARITGGSQLEADAEKQIRAFVGTVNEIPRAYSYFLTAIQFVVGPTKEIVIAGEKGSKDTEEMLNSIGSLFLSEAVLLFHPEQEGKDKELIESISPFIVEQRAIDNKITTYICENFACNRPIVGIDEALQVLKEQKMK